MRNIKHLLFTAVMAVASFGNVSAGNVILTTPEDYQVLSLSPNGKWACGVYTDYSYQNFAFRWNLSSGTIELLGSASASECWTISDDGTVAGTFISTETSANGSPTNSPGYYKDGSWHAVEIPEGFGGAGMGLAITPDGHYMTGVLETSDLKYIPYIWKDGKIHRQLEQNTTGMPYAISSDGQMVAGWRQNHNRAACLWNSDNAYTYLSDYESPWSYARAFSADGKKIVLWGGWDAESEHSTLRAIYDVEDGTTTLIPTLVNDDELEFFGISADYTAVGFEGAFQGIQRAVMWKDGNLQYVEDYLEGLGIDFSGYGILPADDDIYYIFRAQDISDDSKVLALIYYDEEYAYRSMIVMLDQQETDLPPVEFTARQVEGMPSASLTWKAPLGAVGIQGYNVYRDGEKITATPVNALRYFDKVQDYGVHQYKVSAVYGDGNEAETEELSVSLEPKPISAPLSVGARQKGFNGARLQWTAPASNLFTKSYVPAGESSADGFGVSNTVSAFEVAVKFDADEMACYSGSTIREVAFYPLEEQGGFSINIYTRNADGTLELIKSQPVTQTLKLRERNVVTLDEPVSVPAGELIVAVQTNVVASSNSIIGTLYGKYQAGYSDLLRQVGEDDFYSLYDMSFLSGYPYFVSWMIDVIVAPQGAADNIDEIDHYAVYADGEEKGSTQETLFDIDALAEGEHQLGVKAVYATQESSDVVTASLDIKNNYRPVSDLEVATVGLTGISSSWKAPMNDDETTLTYSSGNAVSGPVGPSEYNYSYMASVVFDADKVRNFSGYEVKSVRFYPIADAFFTIIIQQDGNEVAYQEVDDYKLNQWNTIELETPISIDPTSSYRLIVDCFDVDPGKSPLAIDDTPAFEFVSDLYSFDGESWNSYSDVALHGNWMMGMNLVAADGTPMAIDGYDVTIDGEKKNAALLTETSYDYDFGVEDALRHSIVVGVHYTGKSGSVDTDVTYFYIGTAAGIDRNVVKDITLAKGDNFLTVQGDGVEAVAIYSASGMSERAVKGNTVDLGGLPTGIHIVRYKVGGKYYSTKVDIRR